MQGPHLSWSTDQTSQVGWEMLGPFVTPQTNQALIATT
jgi:hypothetical protein